MVGDSDFVKQAMQLSNAAIDLLRKVTSIHGLLYSVAHARACATEWCRGKSAATANKELARDAVRDGLSRRK